MYRQIFITLDKEVWENAKEKSSSEKKRSLTGQFRKLYSDLPEDELSLQILGDKFKKMETVSAVSKETVNLTLKFPDDEFWQARVKSSMARMMFKEFTSCLIETWLRDELSSILADIAKDV